VLASRSLRAARLACAGSGGRGAARDGRGGPWAVAATGGPVIDVPVGATYTEPG